MISLLSIKMQAIKELDSEEEPKVGEFYKGNTISFCKNSLENDTQLPQILFCINPKSIRNFLFPPIAISDPKEAQNHCSSYYYIKYRYYIVQSRCGMMGRMSF
ncbi:Schizosaccharomyces pombe specific protein [Schizosaccharomyces pombe]|uniref:Uncharacterized protein C8E11.12 n=1 Tax=Schizosaccharomyces pombe (strain 972 / ATCC 24843) TaxID=284812 RepID=YFQC_SCHPO|nr:uncharacterized protein SPAC8E11.12 [Schizosaccharomyces pombe]G2TRM4.1 RecName: Full=Uncharacterized protein C8E11.12 [Schizosaccharomyces pombe 972h-]CCD31326.1 sequence orphan [Schizosaccharomyces pombe]|eukprot:NP_001343116.1 uncharacterized protein SPAC8E11.12 [Schizosaccharomyces pombe]